MVDVLFKGNKKKSKFHQCKQKKNAKHVSEDVNSNVRKGDGALTPFPSYTPLLSIHMNRQNLKVTLQIVQQSPSLYMYNGVSHGGG